MIIMNRLISTVTKRCVRPVLLRNFHTGSILHEEDDSTKKAIRIHTDHVLKPIVYESNTIRKHDNERRQQLYEFGLYVATCLPKYVQQVQMQHSGELEIFVCPEGIFQVCSFMRMHHNCCFNQCSTASAIDVPGRVYRFEVFYILLSMRFSERVRIKTYTDELTPLRSEYDNWKACDWYEREIYDMFGIIFTHHPDLRRILTDYGFNGHPLRKDFPLAGYIEVRYDDELKKIVYEPVEFAQEMRQYKLSTPWHYLNNFHEGYNSPLPPDTK